MKESTKVYRQSYGLSFDAVVNLSRIYCIRAFFFPRYQPEQSAKAGFFCLECILSFRDSRIVTYWFIFAKNGTFIIIWPLATRNRQWVPRCSSPMRDNCYYSVTVAVQGRHTRVVMFSSSLLTSATVTMGLKTRTLFLAHCFDANCQLPQGGSVAARAQLSGKYGTQLGLSRAMTWPERC